MEYSLKFRKPALATGVRVPLSKKKATKVFHTLEGGAVVTLYFTDIVEFDDKKIKLRSGGYETVTTKQRMNQASKEFGLGFNVYQIKNIWYVDYKDKTYTFHDGMVIKR